MPRVLFIIKLCDIRRQHFINGGLETKKKILMTIDKNMTIKDKKLSIEPIEWLKPIGKEYSRLEEEYQRLELAENPLNKEKAGA